MSPDPREWPWNESSLSNKSCIAGSSLQMHTHPCTSPGVCACVCVCVHIHTGREFIFPDCSLCLFVLFCFVLIFILGGLFCFIFRIRTKRCFKVMAWETLNVNLSTLWCWLTGFSGTSVMLNIFLREFCLMLDHCSEGCWSYWHQTNGNKMHVLQV